MRPNKPKSYTAVYTMYSKGSASQKQEIIRELFADLY